MTTLTRSPSKPSKRFSLASSASQSRPSVHFDDEIDETLVSYPEAFSSSLKKRLSVTRHPPHNSSPERRHDDGGESLRGRLSSPTKLSAAASCPKIDATPKNDDDSPRRGRRRSIVVPLTTTSVPNIHQMNSKSPRKRRFSTISPPLHDPIYDNPIPSFKRRNSSEDKDDSFFFPRTRKLCIIPPSTNKPPPQVCAEINQRIRSTFHYPDFDFIQHVQHRSYVVRTQHFKDSECVTMLDTGVDDLLQRNFEILSPQPNTSMNIDIRPSPGKGLGMFSQRYIPIGEAFFIEHPTVITPYVIGLSIGLSALYEDIFGKLSEPVFGKLMDLSSSYSISGEPQDVHEAIMRINALAIELPVPNEEFSELNTHRAIFLQTSRCNHSCGPNAKWEWDPKRFSLVLTAVQPIEEGEEITIPYIATNMSTKERQDILSNFYRFECLCLRCVDPPDDDDDDNNNNIEIDIDDHQVSMTWIESEQTTNSEPILSASPPPLLIPSFEKWCLDPTFPDDILINAHKHALQLIEIEQGDHHYHLPTRDMDMDNTDLKHLDAIAMCYGALEDVDNFRKWLERVSEVRSRIKPNQKLVFSRWLSKPTSFPVWGWRRVFCEEKREEREEQEGGDAGSGQDSDSGLSTCMSMGMFDFI